MLGSMSTFLFLFACTDADGKDAASDTASTEAYAHPIVPEAYRGSWDEDSVSCDDAIYYWAFEGSIDADGALTGSEGWYWFFSDEGAETDCVDMFSVTGEEARTPVGTDPCLSCDRDLTATWTLEETGCNWSGYESMFDNDDTDRMDEEIYEVAVMLDADNGMGDLLEQMNAWTFAQDDQDASSWIQRAISTGTYTPTGADLRGAAGVTWEIGSGTCVTIED